MPFLIYGAYGYTGELIAREAVARGLKPILAGRNAERLNTLADELGLDRRAFALDDRETLLAALEAVPFVLHCAGPFARTARPMAEACLLTGTHYVDITGEIGVFLTLAGMDGAAKEANVMLLPGAGFDVVPTDCLALHLKEHLPSATHLELAFQGSPGLSHGTALTALEHLGEGAAVRRNGRIERVPALARSREVDFGKGPIRVDLIPWGDVATAFYSTGIGNVETYTRLTPGVRFLLKMSRYLGPLFQSAPVQALMKALVRQAPPGPTAEQRERWSSYVWGEVRDAAGQAARARLRCAEGYKFTALSALTIAQKVLEGDAPAGFQTPAKAYGADLVLEVPGTSREDLG